jgi:hypothetical protein
MVLGDVIGSGVVDLKMFFCTQDSLLELWVGGYGKSLANTGHFTLTLGIVEVSARDLVGLGIGGCIKLLTSVLIPSSSSPLLI